MSDTAGPQAWGLWNERLKDWFNPGTSRPWFPSREAAERAIPNARRQWPRGSWVVAPFPASEDPTAPGQRPRD